MRYQGTFVLADEFIRDSVNLNLSESDFETYDSVKHKVLVVDDEKLLADTTAAILKGAGFDVKAAYNGWEGLEVARAFRPDSIITDIMMPTMNGVQLAIAIRKMFPATRIFLFSGQAGVSDILEESRAQGYEFPLLAKPVRPPELIARLKGATTS
ncbi:MAG TPA: response regulator [Edaphobacter sp.]